MSATGRGAERVAHDFYGTPAWCVWRLLEACPLPGGVWLEPAVGDGAIVHAVNGVYPSAYVAWITADVRAETGAGHVLDFTSVDREPWLTGERFDVCITNPPYSLAWEFARKGLEVAGVVALLLRLNFLEGEERAEWLRANTPNVYVLPNRPSFTGKGTDATAYAWMVWGMEPQPVRILASTPKAIRCAR